MVLEIKASLDGAKGVVLVDHRGLTVEQDTVLRKSLREAGVTYLARHMGFSKPSISHAVGVLKNGGFLTVDEDGYLNLTNAGREVAEKIYERHQFFTEQLVAVGVDRETAERDACRIEHVISEEAFEKLKTSVEKKY